MKKTNWRVTLTLCALSTAMRATAAPTIKTVHTFDGGTDGLFPTNTLTYHNGALYGTTVSGGAASNGTIYRIDAKTGNERVLYSFQSGSDAMAPAQAALIFHNGIMYGTTPFGGANGVGTIFKFDLGSGIETVLYSFLGGNDGAFPYSGVFYKNGVLYGATTAGGGGSCSNDGCGTLYKFVVSSRTESVLHSFQGGSDSQFPLGEFVSYSGQLFGVTSGVGPNCDGECGSIYTINPDNGEYSLLLAFVENTNTAVGLTKFGHYLYGASFRGGSHNDGTVFRYDPATNGVTTLRSLGGGKLTGTSPWGKLIPEHGSLFGTTWTGGANGAGTVFSVDLSNEKASLLGSLGGSLGSFPISGLAYDGTSFWGTTQGQGTVFKFTLGQ